ARVCGVGAGMAGGLSARGKHGGMANLLLSDADAKAPIDSMDRDGRASAPAAPAADPQADPVKPAPVRVSTAAILEAYGKIQQALYMDKLAGVADAAAAIAAESVKIGEPAAPVRTAAVAVQQAGDL